MADETRTTYTEQQLAAVNGMKQGGLRLGAVPAAFVNNVMAPDGTLSHDVEGMLARANGEVARILATEPKTAAVLRDATRAAERSAEIEEHVSQKRFLFILGDDLLPLIYFQCATEGNPDVQPAEPVEG
jgi:hypothetical protein